MYHHFCVFAFFAAFFVPMPSPPLANDAENIFSEWMVSNDKRAKTTNRRAAKARLWLSQNWAGALHIRQYGTFLLPSEWL